MSERQYMAKMQFNSDKNVTVVKCKTLYWLPTISYHAMVITCHMVVVITKNSSLPKTHYWDWSKNIMLKAISSKILENYWIFNVWVRLNVTNKNFIAYLLHIHIVNDNNFLNSTRKKNTTKWKDYKTITLSWISKRKHQYHAPCR